MVVLSAAEDFSGRTLATIPGFLGKLQYVAHLRRGTGVYSHWGLSRVHGDIVASQAMASTHSELFLQVLRMPIGQLFEDVRRQASDNASNVKQVVDDLAADGELLIPREVVGGSKQHFNSILRALSALADAPGLQNDLTA